MNKTIKQLVAVVILIVLMGGLIKARYNYIFKAQPNDYFSTTGDGFKNLATVVYHIKHDTSNLHFNGMNYPFGEHVLFTDNQPIISNTLRSLSTVINNIESNIVPLMNYFMIYSLIIGAIFLLLIFRKFNIPDWYAIIASIGIMLLSPQIARMGGHFALAYAMFLPIFIYLMLLFEEYKQKRYIVLILLQLIIFAQIHFYYFGILSLFLIAYGGTRYLYSKKTKRDLYISIAFISVVILSYIYLKIWTGLVNNVPDRPTHPYGFFHYRSYWESIFYSPINPILNWINNYIIQFREVEFEGKAFLGLSTAVSLIIIFIVWIKNKGKQSFFNNIPEHKLFSKAITLAALLIMCFALGLPFILPGLGGLVDYLGPIGQMRSIGRFSWVFFNVMNIFCFIYIYKHFSKKEGSFQFALLFPLLLLLSDGLSNIDKHKFNLKNIPELSDDFKNSDKYWFKNIDTDKYQAILPIPYFHIGSENIEVKIEGYSFTNSTIASLISGLPNIGVMMSRTSLSQTYKSLQLTHGGDYRIPEIISEFPNQKPLLIVYDKIAYKNKSNKQYDYLINNAKLLLENEKIKLFELPLNVYDKVVNENYQSTIIEFDSTHLFQHKNLSSTDSLRNFIYLNFDNEKSSKKYYSSGGLEADANGTVLFESSIPNQTPGIYNLSFWVYIAEDHLSMLNYKLTEYPKDDKNKNLLYSHMGLRFDQRKVDGNWRFVSQDFKISDPNSILKLEFFNPVKLRDEFWIDELLIRPVSTNLYQMTSKDIWKNNLHYNLK